MIEICSVERRKRRARGIWSGGGLSRSRLQSRGSQWRHSEGVKVPGSGRVGLRHVPLSERTWGNVPSLIAGHVSFAIVNRAATNTLAICLFARVWETCGLRS